MSAPAFPAAAPPSRLDRACLGAAFGVTLAWFLYYERQPGFLCDEGGHVGNVYHILEGKPGWPEGMTMLPGYHLLVAALWQLHPPVTLLTLARLVSALLSCGGLLAFWLARRRLHGVAGPAAEAFGAGPATLLFALFPVLQPFTGMAYTDGPALALVLMAFAAQLTERYAAAALFFVFAAMMRQTNLTWAAFAIAWEWLRRPAPAAGFLRRTGWLWVLLGAGAVCVALAGRVSVGTQTGTELRPNIATLHAAGLLALVLGLPVWAAGAQPALRALVGFARARPALAWAAFGGSLALIAVLARTFANPHVWNRDLFWPGCSFTLLRNWPLVWIDSHPGLRWVSGATVVAMAFAIFFAFRPQPRRRELWLALGVGALLPAANNLVEPRYFIPAVAFMLLLFRFARRTGWLLATWWALLCAVHAPFIQRGLSLW